jgi:hypothetical protein
MEIILITIIWYTVPADHNLTYYGPIFTKMIIIIIIIIIIIKTKILTIFTTIMTNCHVYGISLAELISQIHASLMLLLLIVQVK